jgi:DNA gyrase subunit A
MAAEEISVYSRATQGVRLMRIGEEARVISVAITEKEEDEESPEEPEDEGSPDEPENVDNEETAPQSDE